jgi:hypothetical protein
MPARARSLALRFCPPLRYSKRALLLHKYRLLAQQLHRRAQKGHRLPSKVEYGPILRVTSFFVAGSRTTTCNAAYTSACATYTHSHCAAAIIGTTTGHCAVYRKGERHHEIGKSNWRGQALPCARRAAHAVASVGELILSEATGYACCNHEDTPSWWGGLVRRACQSDFTGPSSVSDP